MFELSAGQIVADKYRIDGIMAAGGMGVVVAATHLELDQKVAIKFLREVSPEALARFQREARLLVRLKSAHVARVFDVGSLDDDTPYIVMEHLEGSDLASVASARGKLSVEDTVDYVVQAMEAVAEAHALGMVHRDLKPANLFLAKGPGGTSTVKVLDFGVSKILDDRSTGANDAPRGGDLTNEGVALGSPGYMSPEQMTSARDVDERSDIFSFGAVMYRLVGGQNPYKGTSVVSILASMATEKLPPLRGLANDAPAPFTAIVERCLEHDKAARFPTIAHLAHALTPFATRRGRVSIEQILATLNITFPDDSMLGDTLVQPANGRQGSRPSGMPPAPESGPPAIGPAMQTGPHFTVSAPLSIPPAFKSGGPAPNRTPMQWVTLAVTVAALLMLGVVIGWRALSSRRPSEPAPADTAEPSVAAPAPLPESAAPPLAAPPSVVAPFVAPDPPSSANPAADSAKPKPTAAPNSRTRPHASSTARGTSGGPTPPPNPADVPGGRH